MKTLPTLSSLYPKVDDLLATQPEDLVPLLLKIARHVLTVQNGMFALDYVNQLATEANNLHLQQPRYSHAERQKVERLLGETWAFIESERLIMPAPGINGANGFRVFTRSGEEISGAADVQKLQEAAAFPKSLLHPLIAERVWRALMRNDLDDAVFTSFKAVEEAVRNAGGYQPGDIGVALMRLAFDKRNGPLTDMSQPEGERDALAHLFAGAIGSYKNPHSHRTVNLTDLREAQEQVMLASHLLRIIEARRKLLGGHEVDRH